MNISEHIKDTTGFIFDREIELTPQQSEAVHYGDGPLLIIAGAGTGKTYCIARRVAKLVSSKAARMDEILVLSFSEKAAGEMEERIDLILPYSFSDISISTFHSFGRRILSAHCFETGLDPDFQVLTDEEQVIFLEDHLFELPMERFRPPSNPNRYLKSLVQYISRLKDEDISSDEYMEYAFALPAETGDPVEDEKALTHRELALTYKKIEELMFGNGYVDLADLVYLPLRILRNHPMVADYYRQKFKYILVDEFQDTNYTQYQLLKILSQGRRNLTVVGDDDQSIYKFRGAAISNILNFAKDFSDAYQVVLTKNFRSLQKILDSAYRLVTHNNPYRLEVKNGINKRLIGKEEPGAVLFHKVFDGIDSQSEYIVDLVERKTQEGYSFSDIAVLIRNNRDADDVIREFNMREIPFRFSGSSGLYRRPEIRILLSFFRIIADPDDSLSLYYLAASEVYEMNPATLTRLSLYADHTNQTLLDVFRKIGTTEELKNIPKQDIITAARIMQDHSKYTDMSVLLTSGRLLYEFLKSSGYLGRLARREIRYPELKTRNIAIFFDLIKRFEGISQHPYAVPFIRHLNRLIKAGDDPAAAQAETEIDAVSILTVHKAKGLEFPVVIIASLAEGNFPTMERKDTFEIPDEMVKEMDTPADFHIQEERRLFYVAMTRAKKELYLLGAQDLGGKRKRKVSRFIMEALDIPMKSISVNVDSDLRRIDRFSTPAESDDACMEIPPENLQLTPYQIDDYLTCPLKYRYVHIMRIPVMNHHSVVYGKAVRSAVQELLKRKVGGVDVKASDLLSTFAREWSQEGFLSREHEESRFDEGKKSLIRFFRNFEGNIATDDRAMKKFTFYVDEIKISGEWDLMKDNGGETIIFDFRSSDVRDEKTAARKARDSIKNEISLLAYREIFGKNPAELNSYFVGTGLTGKVKASETRLEKTRQKIRTAAKGLSRGDHDPQPEYYKCLYCAYREICPATARDL